MVFRFLESLFGVSKKQLEQQDREWAEWEREQEEFEREQAEWRKEHEASLQALRDKKAEEENSQNGEN